MSVSTKAAAGNRMLPVAARAGTVPAAFLHRRCKPCRKPRADKHAERKHSGADDHSRRPAGQHPVPGPHAMAACARSVNTLTVPVATVSVRSPDTVPTTTVKASANVSLFMVNPPRMALSSHAPLFSRRIYDANVASGGMRRPISMPGRTAMVAH
jgi:hypothetical protein